MTFVENLLRSQKVEMKILLNEKCKNKLENCFCIRFRTLRIFWDQKLNFTTFGGGGGDSACRSLGITQNVPLNPCTITALWFQNV